ILRPPVLIAVVAVGCALLTIASVDQRSLGSRNMAASPQLLTTSYPPPRPAWVSAGPLVVRTGPSTNTVSLGLLPVSQQVIVSAFSTDGAWSQIESPLAGWVSNRFLHFRSEQGAFDTLIAFEEGQVADTHVRLEERRVG